MKRMVSSVCCYIAILSALSVIVYTASANYDNDLTVAAVAQNEKRIQQLLEDIKSGDIESAESGLSKLVKQGRHAYSALDKLEIIARDPEHPLCEKVIISTVSICRDAGKTPDSIIEMFNDYIRNGEDDMRELVSEQINYMPFAKDKFIDALVDACADKTWERRDFAVATLGGFKPDFDVVKDTFTKLLESDDRLLLITTMMAIGNWKTEAAELFQKVDRLSRDPSSNVRIAAFDAIAKIGLPTEETISSLIRGIHDTDLRVMRSAVRGFIRIGPKNKIAVRDLELVREIGLLANEALEAIR